MKTYGICPLSTISIYSKPNKRSEVVSQLLFGETFELIDEEENWVKISCVWDSFEGWIDDKQFDEIEEKVVRKMRLDPAYSLEVSQPIVGKQHYLPILMGSTLPLYDGINLRLGEERFTFSGQTIQPTHIPLSKDLAIKIARKYLYSPFVWGGRSPFGIDSSGLTQMVYKVMGISLPRLAREQVLKGELVDFISEAEIGDLAFFENLRGHIVHAGIIMPEGEVIHASGKVRIDKLDHFGIYNMETRRYTHKLRLVKRLL
jgi:gamma-D-glutamyl-L-lysine dipeptidyl-peptidase